jgi:hypothetical protein
MQIVVEYKDKTFTFQLAEGDTVLMLKEQIQKVIDLAPDRQCLKKDGFQLFNYRSISDYPIENGSTLYLTIGFPSPKHESVAYVEFNDEKIKFEVEDGTTVLQLKKMVQESTGASIKDQTILAVLDDNVLVSDYDGYKLLYTAKVPSTRSLQGRLFFLVVFVLCTLGLVLGVFLLMSLLPTWYELAY